MAIAHLVVIFVSTLLAISESTYVTPLRKCNSKDSECLKAYFQSVVSEVATNGIAEADIPILDPVEVKDYHVSIPHWVNFDFDGIGKGLKTCIINKFWLEIEKRYASIEITCDLSLEGRYKLYSNSTLIRTLIDSDTMFGNGTGSLKFEKFRIKYDFYFNVEQRGDDYFIVGNFDHSKYGFEIMRKASFAADHLFLGKYEASDLINDVMNKNWKLVMDGSGLDFMIKVKKTFFDYTKSYFNNVAVKNYLTDDVSPYVVT